MLFRSPMELTYEKTLMQFILLAKKRYVGILYEKDPNKGKMKIMGLSIKRRDSCDYLKDTYGGILNILMKEHNITHQNNKGRGKEKTNIDEAIHFFPLRTWGRVRLTPQRNTARECLRERQDRAKSALHLPLLRCFRRDVLRDAAENMTPFRRAFQSGSPFFADSR